MADHPIKNPIMLTSEMSNKLKDMAPDISRIEYEIKRAERAGLDISDLKKQFSDMKTMREGLLSEYTE